MAKAKKLNRADRRQFSAKAMDWGNLVFIGLVIAQLVPGEKPVNWLLIILGFFCMVLSYFVAERVMKGGDG
jgi:predicted permease